MKMSTLCPNCGLVCEEDEFKVHTLNNCQPTVRCEQCAEYFANPATLLNHIRAKHNKEFQCNICQKDFISKSNLQRHQAMTHKKLPEGKTAIKEIKCELCDKIFVQKWLLERHIRSEHTKQFTCSLCGRECASKYSLKGHMINVHPNAKTEENGNILKCPQCNKKFAGNWYLTRHIRAKHNKEFTCCHCEKVCCSEYALNRHIKNRHTQEEEDEVALLKRKWKCPQCPQRFNRGWHLKCHIEAQHEERFKCQICGKVLARIQSLILHKKIKHGINDETNDGKNLQVGEEIKDILMST